MTKNCVFSIPCSPGKYCKSDTSLLIKQMLKKHRKAGVTEKTKQLGMTEYIYCEK